MIKASLLSQVGLIANVKLHFYYSFQLAGLTAAQKQLSSNVFFLTTAKEVPAIELLNAIMEDIIEG